MKQKLLRYFFVFFTVFSTHMLVLFMLTAFLFWSLNPLVWSEGGRATFSLFMMINFGFSCFLSSNIFDEKKESS